MTKKDYELFAHQIHAVQHEMRAKNIEMISIADVVKLCSGVFKFDNPAFQPAKFERACYEGKHIRKSISQR